MSIFLFVASILIMVAAYKGTQDQLFDVLKDDFTGKNNFVYWVIAVVLVVAVGNIKQIKRVSDAFLVLLVIVIVFAQYKGGTNLLQSFIDQVKRGTQGKSSSVKIDTQNPDSWTLNLDLGQNLEGLTG